MFLRCSRCTVNVSQIVKHYSKLSNCYPKVAIVGSGPAAFYTAQQILKGEPKASVDLYEKFPVPFGLVRFGVAPDHPEVKNVINTFTQTAGHENFSFIGNVTVGHDISIEQLRKVYTAVILAYGSENDKTLGIPGEDLVGVHSARRFVGWYNGLPEDSQLPVSLDTDTAVILGIGNVALDVARILLTPIDVLRKTDITEHAVEVLQHSRVKRVYLVGRRGPAQVAFTTAELREMTRLPNCKPVLNAADFEGLDKLVKDLPRARKRLTELMIKTALGEGKEIDIKRWAEADNEWHLKFLRSPLKFLPTPDGTHLAGMQLAVNKLEGPFGEKQKAVLTDETEDISCGVAFRSIGYKSLPIDPCVPFDDVRGIIPNSEGRVKGEPGLYCSGWVKRGPVGVIVSTMTDGFETGKAVVEDLKNGRLKPTDNHQGKGPILDAVKQKGITTVSFEDWKKIDAVEKERGAKLEKPREKFVTLTDMLSVLR